MAGFESRVVQSRPVWVRFGDIMLQADLTVPEGSAGLVVFAHGSGSSRHSPRNQFVARLLQQAGLGTLLIDLLTSDEEQVDQRTAHLRFDIEMLAARLSGATRWVIQDPNTRGLPIGYFGASTGAAAALVASVEHPDVVQAIVSRGGRPDLARPVLRRVVAPTLLIVGGHDELVLKLNEEAFALLAAQKRLEVIAGATHLFPEPGALEEVAQLATNWFCENLIRPGTGAHPAAG